MIQIKKIFIISLTVLYGINMKAQESIFSQSNSSALFANPAIAGTTDFLSASLLQRIQWPLNEIAISTSCLSIDFAPPIENAGFSLVAVSSIDLPNRHRVINAGIGYSHQLKIDRGIYLKAGARAGFYHVAVGEDLTYGDQYSETGVLIGGTMEETEENPILKPDFEAGILLSIKNLWLSASGKHLSQPNISMMKNGDSTLSYLFYGQAGYRLYLNDSKQSLLVLTPMLTLFNQDDYNKYSIGSYLTARQLLFGAWYNGDPLQKQDETIQHQSITLNFGMHLDLIKIQYSYDINLSSLTNTGGTHELALSFDFPYTQQQKVAEKAIWGPAF